MKGLGKVGGLCLGAIGQIFGRKLKRVQLNITG